MGKSLRKIKQEKKVTSPFKLMEAWNRGFSAGAREQRKKDIESFAKLIEGLDVKGIGPVLKRRIIQAINEGVGE